MKSTAQKCESSQAVDTQSIVNYDQANEAMVAEFSGGRCMDDNTSAKVAAVETQDDITLREMRIIECRKRRDELFMAVCRGGATPEQEAAYRQACGDVHAALVEYSATFFGPVACNSEQKVVA